MGNSELAVVLTLVLIVNLWWVAFMFNQCSVLKKFNNKIIITWNFWKWYMFWYILLPYSYYTQRNENTVNTENNNIEQV